MHVKILTLRNKVNVNKGFMVMFIFKATPVQVVYQIPNYYHR